MKQEGILTPFNLIYWLRLAGGRFWSYVPDDFEIRAVLTELSESIEYSLNYWYVVMCGQLTLLCLHKVQSNRSHSWSRWWCFIIYRHNVYTGYTHTSLWSITFSPSRSHVIQFNPIKSKYSFTRRVGARDCLFTNLCRCVEGVCLCMPFCTQMDSKYHLFRAYHESIRCVVVNPVAYHEVELQ